MHHSKNRNPHAIADTRHQHLMHRMQDAVRIAAVRNGSRKPPADTKLELRLAQQQQPGIGGLVAPVEIYCDFLAVNTWQVEREQRIFGHGGCGVVRFHEAAWLDTDLLRESVTSRYSVAKFQQLMNIPG
jgi:hypothetical protein